MDITTRNRAELRSYFVKNSIPTQRNFEELIEGMLNQRDDGLVKLPGNPLSIEATGDNASEKKALSIYQNFSDQNPAWTLSLNPRSNPGDASTGKLGFSISEGEGRSRLFIDRNTGNVGVGTVTPGNKLDVQGGDIRTSGNLYWNNGTSVLSADQGGSIELGNSLQAGATPYIDFHYGAGQQQDFNIRIINGADRKLAIMGGDVGIGVEKPSYRLSVSDTIYSAKPLAPAQGKEAQIAKRDAKLLLYDYSDVNWAGIGVDEAGDVWIRTGTAASNLLTVRENGNVGIGTPTPGAKLDVTGAVLISDGSGWAPKNNHMASGSLTIGSTNSNYGGGQNWSTNTAGLLLETKANTEIAVHDSNTRLASFIYYEGDNANQITIGRDMGWGAISNVILNGTLQVACGGTSTWNKLVVTPTSEWGDSNATYVTIGAGGAAGIMLSNPHVTWRDSRASIRYGRSGGGPGGAWWDVGVRGNNAFSFALNGDDHKLWLAGSGNVGVANTAPDHVLVVGPASGGRHLVINDIPTARWGFATGGYALSIQNDGDGGNWKTRFLISKEGNITTGKVLLAMGTTDGSQAAANEVVGGMGFYGFGRQHGLLSFRVGSGFEMIDCSRDAPTLNYARDSYPYADLKVRNLAQASSKESKENIVDLCAQEAFEALAGLNAVKFSYINDAEKHIHAGFIAEDSPDIVVSPDGKGIQSMDIVAILTRVVKEQQKIISTLERKVETLAD